MKYGNILYVTHHLIGDCGNITEYFATNSRHFFVFSMCPTFMNEPNRLEEYVGGKKVRTWRYGWYKGQSLLLKYVFIYLAFAHARLFRLPRKTDVLTYHPLFCVGNLLFRLLKGGRTVFWVFDYFDQKDGLYPTYNKLADFYVRSLPRVLFLGANIMAVYEHRFGKRPDAHWEVLNLGIKVGSTHQMPERGRLGFIGNLKEGQGLEHVMDALRIDRDLRLDVVGIGITLERLKAYAAEVGVAERVRFLGKVLDGADLEAITSRWEVASALYARTSFTPYADPGKIKLYLQCELPIITTNATPIAAELEASGAGTLCDESAEGFLAALERIRVDRDGYARAASVMAKKFEYVSMYGKAFAFLESDGV